VQRYHYRFSPLSATVEARLQQASLEQLETWTDRLVDPPKLEALFRLLRAG